VKTLVDNDILFKGACYRLLVHLVPVASGHNDSVGVLGAAWFVVSKTILRKASKAGAESAIEILRQFLQRATVIEPTQDEQRTAADFEVAAQRAGLSLDAGESQLCAIMVSRQVPLLLTGDKRAIKHSVISNCA
jgi:hypothetical protein